MGELITTIFSSFTDVITNLAGGLSAAFTALIYANGESGSFSPLVLFILTFAGIGLAAGLLWKIFGLIKGKTGRPM